MGSKLWGSENNVFKEFHQKEKEKSGGFYFCMLFYDFRLVLLSVCCLSRIMVMIIIISKYCVSTVWQVWLF